MHIYDNSLTHHWVVGHLDGFVLSHRILLKMKGSQKFEIWRPRGMIDVFPLPPLWVCHVQQESVQALLECPLPTEPAAWTSQFH